LGDTLARPGLIGEGGCKKEKGGTILSKKEPQEERRVLIYGK
jgi:hypothetical protein